MARKDKENEPETVHFWRGKMPTIVWDKRKDRSLVDFSKGHIFTSDPYTIEVLREIGYIEIPLDAERPPDIIEPIQPAGMPDVKSLPRGLTEKAAAEMQRTKMEKQPYEDKDGPAVPAPKAKADKAAPALNPVINKMATSTKTSKKRTLKRRNKK